jgi:hypothetical protein
MFFNYLGSFTLLGQNRFQILEQIIYFVLKECMNHLVYKFYFHN